MLVNFGVSIFGILIFLFIFWERLREDYAGEIIFQSGTYITVGIGLGWAFATKFFPDWFFWTSLLGGAAGLMLAIIRFGMKFYETLEAFSISLLPWLGLIFLSDSVIRSSLSSFLAFIAILIMVFISYWLDLHYKGFTWYKSGRIGFAGLAVAALIFTIRSFLAISRVTMLSFVGKYEAIVSGGLAFICFLLLFDLGRIKK